MKRYNLEAQQPQISEQWKNVKRNLPTLFDAELRMKEKKQWFPFVKFRIVEIEYVEINRTIIQESEALSYAS